MISRDLRDDPLQRLAGLGRPARRPGSTWPVEVGDQGLDLLGGLGRALGQRPHLGGDDCKAAAGIARARRFDAGVQRQQVGLERDLVDHADDLADLLGGLLDVAHGRDRLAHHLAALLGIILGGGDDLAGVAGALGGLLARWR